MFSSPYGDQITVPGFVIVPGRKGKGRGVRTDVCPCPSAGQLSHPPQSAVSVESLPWGLRLPPREEAGPRSAPVSRCGQEGGPGHRRWLEGRKVPQGGTVLPPGSENRWSGACHSLSLQRTRVSSQTISKTTELWASAMILTESPDLSEPQSPIQNRETGTILSACYGREMRLYRKSVWPRT